MRKALAVAALIAWTPAEAQDIGPLTKAVFNNMALSYWCRNEIGEAHYSAARTIATDVLSKHIGQSEAVLAVDRMDRQMKEDPRTENPTANAAQCHTMKSDAMHAISVEQAKLGD